MVNQLQFYKDFYEYAPIGFFTTSLTDGEFLRANPCFVKLLGYDSFEEIDVKATDLYPEALRSELIGKLNSGIDVTDFEIELTIRDGTTKWIWVSARLCRDRNCMEGSVIDITESKKMHLALEAYRNKEADMLQELNKTIKQRLACFK